MKPDTPTVPPETQETPTAAAKVSAPKIADKLARFMEKMDREMGR